MSRISVEDTEKWRRELARIAEMVGLVTTEELTEIDNKKEAPIIRRPSLSSANKSVGKSPLRSANGEYSHRTGRWNETPKTISRSRSLSSRRTPLSAIVPNHLFCVDEQEREMWMLQVLCQILHTEDVNEIQSWLVSSSSSEKDAVRQLITSAIAGLEENGRIQPTAYFDENAKAIQVNMDTFGSLISHKFPNVSSNQLLTSMHENPSKPPSRARTSPQVQSTSEYQNKSTRVFHSNLEPIDEKIEKETHTKIVVPQPTKNDVKRDIQVLTLNDDGNNNQQLTHENPDHVPF